MQLVPPTSITHGGSKTSPSLRQSLPPVRRIPVRARGQVSMETAAGRDVFSRRVRERPRMLSPVQHLRPVGARLRRLLVRVVVHVGARLLPQVPDLRPRLAHWRRRLATRRRRQVHQPRVAAGAHLLMTSSQRLHRSPSLTRTLAVKRFISDVVNHWCRSAYNGHLPYSRTQSTRFRRP